MSCGTPKVFLTHVFLQSRPCQSMPERTACLARLRTCLLAVAHEDEGVTTKSTDACSTCHNERVTRHWQLGGRLPSKLSLPRYLVFSIRLGLNWETTRVARPLAQQELPRILWRIAEATPVRLKSQHELHSTLMAMCSCEILTTLVGNPLSRCSIAFPRLCCTDPTVLPTYRVNTPHM
jgi:hypothetical protein